MKYSTLLFIFFSIVSTLPAQQTSNWKNITDQRYEGGHKTFKQHVYDRLEFPKAARIAGVTGILKTKVEISEKGEILGIAFQNELHPSIEAEVRNAISNTADFWLEGAEKASIQLKIAFYYGELEMEPKGDINIVAFHVNPGVLVDDYYLNKLEKYMRKKRYKKALPHCKELLRRHPDDQKLNKYMQAINERVN